MIPLFLYAAATCLFSPLIVVWLLIRAANKKEDLARFRERMGFPKTPRPKGKLIWMHGASVGECLSMMVLIEKILKEDKTATVLVTSGTCTSARLMAKRLPKRAFHQYIPVDFPWAAHFFVRHFKPDVILWFESDFWPNILRAVAKTKKPLVLLNGRISDRSFAKWQKAPCFIRQILKSFTLCFGQTAVDAERLKTLGAAEALSVGNLKCAAVNPPVDSKELHKMLAQIGARPRFLIASTHPGEEQMAISFHKQVAKAFPGYLSIIAPRHPERADALEKEFTAQGFRVARRSRGENITKNIDIYIADTIGEMGLIYQLSDLVFVGGSLVPFGGQNMLEPMRFRRTVMIGPHAFNFRAIVKEATRANALIIVQSAAEMEADIVRFLSHPEETDAIARQGYAFAVSQTAVLDRVYDTLHERVGL